MRKLLTLRQLLSDIDYPDSIYIDPDDIVELEDDDNIDEEE